jgi:hypothetical protein
MNRILLQCGSKLRKFISFSQDENDGSLYITFNRKGNTKSPTCYFQLNATGTPPEPLAVITGEVPKRFDVHYHTTGRVNFKDLINPVIFGEPLTAITKNFWFASLIVPEYRKLDLHSAPLMSTDYVFLIEGAHPERRQFDLCMSPFGQPISSYGLAKGYFSYPNFYTLNVIESDQPIAPMESDNDKFSFISPPKGLFEKQQISRESAHIKYHQMRLGHNGPIMYGPNEQYEYRVIFPKAATEPPMVDASFKDSNYTLEILCVSKSQARFKVIDSSGAIVKEPVQFTRVELGDCRLTLR